jgi:alcohol dehydrogenase
MNPPHPGLKPDSTTLNRAVIFYGPDSPQTLETRERPEPGPGRILVRVRCCTLCGSDLHTHSGRRSTPLPTILGHEILGEIAAFGAGAPPTDARGLPLREGDRVTWSIAACCGHCFFCARGLNQKCEHLFKYGHEAIRPDCAWSGGLADWCVLEPGTTIVRLSDDLPDTLACPANCATATVAGALRLAGELRESSVLVLGAGMLGLTACAMARSLGATAVVAVDVDAERSARALRFGATEAFPIDPTTLDGRARRFPGGGFDVALELSGAPAAIASSLASVRLGGTVVLVGSVFPSPPLPLDPEKVVRRMITIRGLHNYAPADLIAAVAFLEEFGASYPFAELVAASYPLDDFERAFRDARSGLGPRVAVVP